MAGTAILFPSADALPAAALAEAAPLQVYDVGFASRFETHDSVLDVPAGSEGSLDGDLVHS